MAFGQDRAEELEGIRKAIADSRGRVGEHQAEERTILEELEQVDRRLQTVTRKWTAAGREVTEARRRLKQIEPELEAAATALGRTQQALSTRASALYRGGELGPVRVIFSSESLPELLSRAGALRVLVRHDAGLVARYGEERDRIEGLETQAREAIQEREQGRLEVAKLVTRLETERAGKGAFLDRIRRDRKGERRLLLELEQAAQALEETIRTLGVRVREGERGLANSNFSSRQGFLSAPVKAKISLPFGRVIDPEFHTATFRSGVDFAARAGTVVRSVGIGVIRFAGWFRGYGRIVIIDHGGGFHSICGHLDEIFVAVGDRVDEAQRLGSVGETGSLGGPSLYFELRRNGEAIDPEPWLAARRG
jgi:septal ring factor EnvC (AmiA/AmiB activator)